MAIPSVEDVAKRLAERAKDDFLGFETSEYLERLPFEHAKPHLKPEATAEEWAKLRQPLTREALLKTMLDYMDFAWEKANGFRGISAGRSIAHFVAWTWMAGDAELSVELEEPYEFYGKDHLRKICQHYGWDADRWDDGVRKNSEDE